MQSTVYRIMSTDKNGAPVERKVVDISTPRTNGEPRKIGTTEKDRLKAALRMYGGRVRSDANGPHIVGTRSGKRIWAEPVEVQVKSGNKGKKNKGKNKSAPVTAQTAEPTITTDPAAPYGYDTDGTPLAPYGLKLDGTPAKRRGRKPAAPVEVAQIEPVKVKRNKRGRKSNAEKQAEEILAQVKALQEKAAALMS